MYLFHLTLPMKKIPRKGTGSDEKDLWRHAQPTSKEKFNSLGGVM